MTVCPVCEHSQEIGFECDVCGKDLSGVLGALGPPPVAVARLGELESTAIDRVGEVHIEQVAALEVNVMPAAPDAPAATTPDLQLSRVAPVGEVPVERVGDLTVDRVADDGVRTAAPSGQVTCRYCKNVQQVGTVCERCGMRLPAPMALERAAPNLESVRCRACGAKATASERCRECGRLVPPPDA